MTNTNQNTAARRQELEARLEELNAAFRRIEDAAYKHRGSAVTTAVYVYGDFFIDSGCVYFSRGAQRFEVDCLNGFFRVNTFGLPNGEKVSYSRLPRAVRTIIEELAPLAKSAYEITSERADVAEELNALGNDDDPTPPAPIRRQITLKVKTTDPMVECPLSRPASVAYSYASAIRSTLADRVNARALLQEAEPVTLADGSAMVVNCADVVFEILGIDFEEVSPCSDYTVRVENFAATLAEVDKDLTDDLREALEEIDPENVRALRKYADDAERLERKAQARCYREVAELAAIIALLRAVESQPELAELFPVLAPEGEERAPLPPSIADAIADELSTAREVLSVSLLFPQDVTEARLEDAAQNWAFDYEFFASEHDPDVLCAFTAKPSCGVWISYFNSLWIFENDGVVDASSGSFESQPSAFVETIRQYIIRRVWNFEHC